MVFFRRVFTALLCTPVVLPLTAALAMDLQTSLSTADLLSALQGSQKGRPDASTESMATPPPLPDHSGPAPEQQAVVRFGDTLDTIAQRNGLSTDQLLQLNPDLRLNSLVVGRTLDVQPAAVPRVRQLISLRPSTSGAESWPETPNYTVPSQQLGPSGARWMWPAKGLMTSGYGWRWGRMHKGIDVANSVGTPIVAAQQGRVTFAGWSSGGYGYLVEITHDDGSRSLYAHQSRILVNLGEEVRQGQQIGLLGSTGHSTGPHLHFEIHAPGLGAINPLHVLEPAA